MNEQNEATRLEYAEIDYQLYAIKDRIAELQKESEQYWSNKKGLDDGNGN